jgi:transposase-like protein
LARIEVVISKSHQAPDQPPGTTGDLLAASAAPAVGFASGSEANSAENLPASSPLSIPDLPAVESMYTAADLLRDFPDDDVCLEYVKEWVWPNGLAHCIKCGVTRKHYRVTGRKAYACNHCGRHIYPLAGTIFSKSTTPLRTWFYILYLMLSTRGLLSARQIQRETGVTYKTAWRSRGEILGLFPVDVASRASSHGSESAEQHESARNREDN